MPTHIVRKARTRVRIWETGAESPRKSTYHEMEMVSDKVILIDVAERTIVVTIEQNETSQDVSIQWDMIGHRSRT
jgi:hypothetical protein